MERNRLHEQLDCGVDKDKGGGIAHVCDSRTCLEALVEDSAAGMEKLAVERHRLHI